MSRDADAKNARLFDRRTVDRNIKKGFITRKDYEKHMKGLPDVVDKGTHGSDEPAEAPAAPAPAAGGDSTNNSHN